MEGSCGTHGYEKVAFVVFGEKTRRKETASEIKSCTWENNIKIHGRAATGFVWLRFWISWLAVV
jgi:hypothetical protein